MFLVLSSFSFSQLFAVDNEVLTSFHQVSPSIFRGARPEEKDFYQLTQLGVKTIISLEKKFSEKERNLADQHGLVYTWIPVHPIFTPRKEQVDEIITLLKNPVFQPVFIHCKEGKVRTGLVIAAYRIIVENWTFEDAYKEMKKYGFSSYLFWWKNFLRKYTQEKTKR